ncbi:hypothetical protein BGZ83_007924 [Gryganskiella cystojenkinii]|nr:hypothetical protein BGZ83_007924 [Gryganskiella cystojenkinii]
MPPVLPPPGSSVPGSGGSGSGFIEAVTSSAMTMANNIAFRPMNAQHQPAAKCSKLKIRIFFDSTIFQAGGNLFGRMEVTATSSRSLKLGEIAVELAAYEEITSKEFTATQSFLSSRLCFQGAKNLPPSNAVHGSCDENGFWMAKKGKTTFPFAFQLPLDCPSSLVFGQTASLRYVVTGLVQVFYHGKDETVIKTKEAFVVEAWDGYNPEYRLPVRASNSTKLFWGGSGNLMLEAMLSERLHSAGGNLTVEVKVTNNTSRKVQGIRLGVARKLEMVADRDKAERNPHLKIDTVSVSEVIGTHEFKSSSYLFDTGEERSMTINMIVPGNARTIRGTALFEVTCFVTVSMLLGAFSGELAVEIPIKICHPASLTPAPKPQLDHLPHQYNLVTDDMDIDDNYNAGGGPPSGRVGSSEDLTLTNGEGEDGTDPLEFSSVGRQGEWRGDERELSPANSITSIRSILSSPKHKLSKLADKIQRSTSPTSSSHLQHEHRRNQNDDAQDPVGRRFAKSPPLGPAVPLAYVPAVERVRYTPFAPPPTTKAKEFLKAAAQYQQERAFGGALAGLGNDNVEFDLDDKTMASAIHQWISKKETADALALQNNQPIIRAPKATRPTPSIPISIPTTVSPPGGRGRRPQVQAIDTKGIGSFSSQYSPLAASPHSPHSPSSPHSPRSPAGFGEQNGLDQTVPASPTIATASSPPKVVPQTSGRFLHHPHRQAAAPQMGEFGSAPEDSITEVPLFARPLPLPSPPPTGSPHRQEVARRQPPRALSPVPIPIQTAESLALAKEAYERVKRVGSPVPDLSPTSSAPKSGFIDPPRASSLERDPNIKVPVPQIPATVTSLSTSTVSKPSELSRLLNQDEKTIHHQKHARDGHEILETAPPPRTCASPELKHVPMNRPLPVPGPKPRHLNQGAVSQPQANAHARAPSPLPAGPQFETSQEPSTALPASTLAPPPQALSTVTQTSSGHLRTPQASPIDSTQTSSEHLRNPTAAALIQTSSGHLRNPQPSTTSATQPNAYVPKPTPVPAKRPPSSTATAQRARSPTNNSRTDVAPSQRARSPASRLDAAVAVTVSKKDSTKPGSTATARSSSAQRAGGEGPSQGPGSGFVYPKAQRKPVPGVKPTVGVKPKTLATAAHPSSDSSQAHLSSLPRNSDVTTDPRSIRNHKSQGLVQQEERTRHRPPTADDPFLPPIASIRAPQVVVAVDVHLSSQRSSSPQGRPHSPAQPHQPSRPRAPAPVVQASDGPDQGRSQHRSRKPVQDTALATVPEVQVREHVGYHRHQHQERHDDLDIKRNDAVEESVQTEDIIDEVLDLEFSHQDTDSSNSEFRAQAIAAANSLRAVGANSSSRYQVNTSILRQAINSPKKKSGQQGQQQQQQEGSGSGHLIQAFADGAKSAASAAASVAASGLGWSLPTSTSSTSTSSSTSSASKSDPMSSHVQIQRPSSPPQRQRASEAGRRRREDGGESKDKSLDVVHDLTMKDINFQTVSSVHPVAAVTTPVPIPILESDHTAISVTASVTETRVHEQQEARKSNHLVASATTAVASATAFASAAPVTVTPHRGHHSPRSQPGSKFMSTVDEIAEPIATPVRNLRQVLDPRMSVNSAPVLIADVTENSAVAVAVSVSTSSSSLDPSTTTTETATATAAAGEAVVSTTESVMRSELNLDKTLPKIQEVQSRSKVFERPEKKDIPVSKGNVSTPAQPISGAAAIANKYREKVAAAEAAAALSSSPPTRGPPFSTASSSSSAGSGSSPTGPTKAINPKLQAYIQKYNQATNAR